MIRHLTHDIGWPTLTICALILGLITPGLVSYARFELRLYRRARRWRTTTYGADRSPVTASRTGAHTASTATPTLSPVAVEADPLAVNAAWGFARLVDAMHKPADNVVELHPQSRRIH